MNFFEGYVVGRMATRGRYRRAAPGSGLPLYGGAIATGFGAMMWVLDNEFGAPLFVIGCVLVVIGLFMQLRREDSWSVCPQQDRKDEDAIMSVIAFFAVIGVVAIAICIGYLYGFHQHS